MTAALQQQQQQQAKNDVVDAISCEVIILEVK
jgi:hypothetical protein